MGLETRPPPDRRPATDAREAAPAETRAAPPPPEHGAAGFGDSAPELPPIAAKADDLEAIKKAVDDAASVGGGLWLSYLFVMFYLAVAAGAVTHADLFLEKPVKLPFLGIELPLVAFFAIAPILFVIVHAYTLVHLVILSEKAKRYHQALHDPERAVTDAVRENLQWQLPSNIFIQFLSGPSDLRDSAFGWLLRTIGWITLVIAPILLLLLMQIQFLPFHSSFITWTQRVALLADLILIWWLWRRIVSGREIDGPRSRRLSRLSTTLGVAFSACAVIASWALATFPGEWQEERLAGWKPIHERDVFRRPTMVSVHDWIFQSRMDDTTHRRRLPLSSTLVLPDLNVYEDLKIDDPEKLKRRDYVFRARGRDLRGAIFSLATLPKVDFEGAQLQGAALVRSELQGSSLNDAQLQGGWLAGANLQGASLDRAQLEGASLNRAQLQGASLEEAQLQGASLNGAQLQGASLEEAQLQGASLYETQLQGASLERAQLQGASLDNAQLQGASLVSAQLQGISLSNAALKATDLRAILWRTNPPTPPSKVSALGISSGEDTWLPEWEDQDGNSQLWDDKAYQGLRKQMEGLPAGVLRDEALERISRLDCASPDKSLASCDPNVPAPPDTIAWRKTMEAARVDEKVYAEALVKALKDLVCSGGDDATQVVRGPGFQDRLSEAGPAASELMDDLMSKDSKDCLVAGSLSDADRAKLLRLKRDAEEADK